MQSLSSFVDECSICLDILNRAVYLPDCGHKFHEECIVSLVPKNCPRCRKSFTIAKIDHDYNSLVERIQKAQKLSPKEGSSSDHAQSSLIQEELSLYPAYPLRHYAEVNSYDEILKIAELTPIILKVSDETFGNITLSVEKRENGSLYTNYSSSNASTPHALFLGKNSEEKIRIIYDLFKSKLRVNIGFYNEVDLDEQHVPSEKVTAKFKIISEKLPFNPRNALANLEQVGKGVSMEVSSSEKSGVKLSKLNGKEYGRQTGRFKGVSVLPLRYCSNEKEREVCRDIMALWQEQFCGYIS